MVWLWRHSIRTILLILLALYGQAQAVVTLHDHTPDINIGRQIDILEDPGGSLTLEQVRASDKFVPSPGLRPSFGFSSSAYWARVRVANLSSKPDWLLQVRYAPLDFVDFYTPDANGSDEYRVQRSGDLVPPDGGKRTRTYLQFPLLNEERVHTYYLRIKTQSSVILDLKILQRDTLITQTIHEQYFQGAYFGLMCVMALYNFFVFLVIRDRSYLYYTGFITSTAVFQIALHGYAGVHFWPESVWWNNISNLFAACLSVGFCGKFAQNFIQLKQYHYTLDRVISWSAAGCFCIGAASLVINYQTIVTLISIAGFAVVTLTLIAAVLAWRKGSRPAGFYLIAWIVLLTFALLHILIILGILPSHPVLENSVQIGGAVEAILLSMGLADRISTLQKNALAIANNASQMQDAFMSSTAQALLTPLSKVRQSLSELEHSINTESDRQWMKTASDASAYLMNLIESMSQFVALRRGNAQLNCTRINLKPVLRRIHDYFESINDNDSLHFHFSWDARLPDHIIADAEKIASVTVELMQNARTFTQQGHVALTAELVPEPKPLLRLSVGDSGPGISPEKIECIEHSFKLGTQSPFNLQGGAGLGLTMSNDMLKLMHSHLIITSKPGQGTTVHFDLPLQEAP